MQPLLTSEPTRIGDYRMLARIGRGAMGSVYLGRSRGGRVVAVKVIRADLADDAEFRERFRREVAMVRSVGGFWTATVVDADTEAEQPWLATEYVPGPTLHKAVAEHGPLPERSVRGLAAGLAEALGGIHRAGLVHRDLKPANILLGPDGPRVIDFGISRAMTGSALTATGMFMGTPGFFSPEQTSGEEVGPPSDVFSLGAVLVFAATGAGPFGNENTAAMLYRVVHDEPDLSAVPQGLRPLLAACLAKDPAARPGPRELLDRIGEASPEGSQWLPSEITAVITEAATELQRTAVAEPPAPKPATRGYTQAQPAPPVAQAPAPTPVAPQAQAPATPAPAAPAPATPAPAAPAPAAPAPAPAQQRGQIVPARPRQTSQSPAAPQVRKDQPGPVFHTGGRVGAFVSGLVIVLLMLGAHELASQASLSGDPYQVYRLGMLLLGISAVWSAARVLMPRLRLKINGDGIRVSRLGLAREIPWSHVRRVAVVGSGKKQAVAVWLVDGVPAPRSSAWHRTSGYHGGARVFPIGATGGWWTRRQEAKRVRAALAQYGHGRYDTSLL
ncbi:serine/threonine-protein kinase [Saccharopolyspora taberi]|uniref:Protein kinase domain-containing protein n=1 Tax=Saccharopolyspora taberi TaxID=60895 RepID=A0ABN3VFU6_9PSEU